jgi:hypothetical protein
MFAIAQVSVISCNIGELEDVRTVDMEEYFEKLDFPADSIKRQERGWYLWKIDRLWKTQFLIMYTPVRYGQVCKQVRKAWKRSGL